PTLPGPAARRLLLADVRWIELLEPVAWRREIAEVLGAIIALHRGEADTAALAAATLRPEPRIRSTAQSGDHLSRLISVASFVMSRGEADLAELAEALGVTEKQ